MSQTKKQERRLYSADQKAAIVRRHLADKVAISDLCDEYSIAPSVFYGWLKVVHAHLAAAFERQADVSNFRKVASIKFLFLIVDFNLNCCFSLFQSSRLTTIGIVQLKSLLAVGLNRDIIFVGLFVPFRIKFSFIGCIISEFKYNKFPV